MPEKWNTTFSLECVMWLSGCLAVGWWCWMWRNSDWHCINYSVEMLTTIQSNFSLGHMKIKWPVHGQNWLKKIPNKNILLMFEYYQEKYFRCWASTDKRKQTETCKASKYLLNKTLVNWTECCCDGTGGWVRITTTCWDSSATPVRRR